MWLLIGIIIYLAIVILIPIFRYRSYWNKVLKDPRAKYRDPLYMTAEHFWISMFEIVDYDVYSHRVLQLPDYDTCNIMHIILGVFLTLPIFFIIIPLYILYWIGYYLVGLIRKKIKNKIELNKEE